MAETVILSTVSKIGVALGNEAVKQASFQFRKFITQLTELHGSMGRIRTELRLMHGFLCRVDLQDLKNENYGIWVQELRMLAHGIEDIVDEYLFLVGHKHNIGWGTYLKKGFKRPNMLLSFNRIASFVKEAEVNLVHLFKAKDRWVSMLGGLNSGDPSYIVERSQHLASISRSLGEEDLVGIDKSRKELLQLLTGNDLERSMIALHGIGGLGKTSLAANVYKEVRENFGCHAWVSISQNYSIKDVLKCLITELYKEREDKPGDIHNMDTDGLQHILMTFLTDKKYLIIFDDVWNREAYNDLSQKLPQNMKGSRLIITTREGDVAALASPTCMLTIESLQPEEAEVLFYKTVFLGDPKHEYPEGLKSLSMEIVSKCKGLPLAIVSVGSLLRVRQKTVEEWRRINDQLNWELINNPMFDHIRNVLYLSYFYLPTHLRSCFLYCSLFPEDHLFHRKKLARLWMAEGFIEERGASTLEEVAEGYMEELVHRNMLQLVERNSFGRIKIFKIHDILRELAVDLCRKDCFGVVCKEVKRGESLEKDGRRLVVHKLRKDIEQSISSVHQLRSLIALDNNMPVFTLLPMLSEKSRYLTVLELRGLPIVNIPHSIGDLFNLRHLDLRASKVKMLPKSVEKLSNLLTLDLHNSDVHELPSGIVKLKKLRHLFAQITIDTSDRKLRKFSGVPISQGLGNLINLQTLQALVAEDESVRQLGELSQLRSLRLLNVKTIHCGSICTSLAQMPLLSHLNVAASDENEVLEFNALPQNLQRLAIRGKLDKETLQAVGQDLYELTLTFSRLIEDPLRSLSRLKNLTELYLTQAYNGKQLLFQREWLPNLKTLWLRDLPHLERLEIEEGAMVTLEKLFLVNLTSMTEVPPGIKFLVTLQYLSFSEITPDFLTLLSEYPRVGGMRTFWYSLRAELPPANP